MLLFLDDGLQQIPPSPTITTMTMLLTLLVLFLSVFHLDAFLPDAPLKARRSGILHRHSHDTPPPPSGPVVYTHADITWKLRPPPETSPIRRWWLKVAANLIRWDCRFFGKEAPFVLCPKGGRAVLEAYFRRTKVGRFGFSTERGPPAPPLRETVSDLYDGVHVPAAAGVGAIVYMHVEPEYRGRNIGAMALEVISLIQAIQGIDFTVLVVDDDGSGKLIDWYLRHGYSKAPKLQDILGSPGGKNGITMIAPTNSILPCDCTIQWW